MPQGVSPPERQEPSLCSIKSAIPPSRPGDCQSAARRRGRGLAAPASWREASSTAPSTVLCLSIEDAITTRSRRGYRPAKMLDHWWGIPLASGRLRDYTATKRHRSRSPVRTGLDSASSAVVVKFKQMVAIGPESFRGISTW
jgi:hypothetical protein